MRLLYCTWAILVLAGLSGSPAKAGRYVLDAQAAGQGSTGYTIFLRGAPVGREDITVRRDASGITVSSQGRLSGPFNASIKDARFRYRPDWALEEFSLDATVNGAPVTLKTSFAGGVATTSGSQRGAAVSASHPVQRDAIGLSDLAFSGYAALALRLASMAAGAQFRVYLVPVNEIAGRVVSAQTEQMQLGATLLKVRRYELVFANPGGDFPVNLTTDESGALLRFNVAAQGLDVVRDDVAASTSRMQVHTNPGDEPITIPAAGFNLGGTLTRPLDAARGGAQPGAARLPAVILVSGSDVGDREGFALGLPLFGQLAGTLADAGFLVVRYDKRGHGQSGGRAESATISDAADDVRTVFRWLSNRKDVDPRRIAILGHSDGAWTALLTAARERRIAGVISVAAPSTPGTEWNLEQQQLAFERLNTPVEDREKRLALQKQIQSAVLAGKGWEGIPADLRRQADTPLFQSLLAFQPARVIEDVRQPLLFVHGALDRQVPVIHVEQLATLARTESDSKSVELVVVRGVNHLLVPATTGEVSEYATLPDRTVSKDVTDAIAGWLGKTLAGIR